MENNTEQLIFDQSSSKEEDILAALFPNQDPFIINSNYKKFPKNVLLLLLIDQYSCLMYNLVYENNNIITNTLFLIQAHKFLMNKSKDNNKSYVIFLDNSDLQNNL